MITYLKLLIITCSMFGIGLLAQPVHAQFTPFGDVCASNPDATVCKDATNTDNPIFGPKGIVTVLVGILSIVIGVAAVIVIIIAGIQYMLSTGDPTKTNNSKNAILYALVGLGVAAFAQVIVKFLLQRL